MHCKASLLAALFLLALPAAASAHVTFWPATAQNFSPNTYFEGVQGVHTFGCGEIVAVDADPNTPTPAVEYVETPTADGLEFGASLKTFSAETHFHGAGGRESDSWAGTNRFLPYLGYPADQYLGTKWPVTVTAFGVTFTTLKLHAYGGLWIVKHLC